RPQPAISLSSNDDDTCEQMNTNAIDEEASSPTGDYVFRIIFFTNQEAVNNNGNNRQQGSPGASDSSLRSSQSSLSPSTKLTSVSASLPTSPIDATFATSPVYVSPTTGFHRSISVR
ncbi:unnamed protein product, partial [Rotaria magnacalcarata]